MKGLELLGNFVLIEKIDVKSKQEKKSSLITVSENKFKDDKSVLSVYDEHPGQGIVMCLGDGYEGDLEEEIE